MPVNTQLPPPKQVTISACCNIPKRSSATCKRICHDTRMQAGGKRIQCSTGNPRHWQREPPGELKNPFQMTEYTVTEPTALPLGIPPSHPHTRPWEK